jgi:hypothetical protein
VVVVVATRAAVRVVGAVMRASASVAVIGAGCGRQGGLSCSPDWSGVSRTIFPEASPRAGNCNRLRDHAPTAGLALDVRYPTITTHQKRLPQTGSFSGSGSKDQRPVLRYQLALAAGRAVARVAAARVVAVATTAAATAAAMAAVATAAMANTAVAVGTVAEARAVAAAAIGAGCGRQG